MAHGDDKMHLEKIITKDGVTKKLSVEEVENGFIVCIYKYGEMPTGEYIDIRKKYISKTNPLSKQEDEQKEEEASILDSLSGMMDL